MPSKSETRIQEIAIADIDRSRNHRIPRVGDGQRLDAIKASIEACGQLQPVRVYERGSDQKDSKHKEPYILGFGARRCKAMELLGRTTIQAIIFPQSSDAQIAQARAVENLHRQDITPLEEVQAVADVLEAIKADPAFTGDPYDEAAARLGCEPTWVRDRDYLHRLTKPVQKFALRTGIPAGHLRELAKVGDPREQMRLACESIGAQAHVFPAEKEERLEKWQQESQERFFAALDDGKVQRWPLIQLKDQVAKVRLSLRQIPWHFEQPVVFGSTKLRKCAGCPHNSETDRTLFGIDEDAANPQGFCLHPACYNAKYSAVEAVKEQIFKKINSKDDQSPASIRKFSPEWIKEATVVGYVQRQLEKAKAKGNGKSAASPEPDVRPPDPRQRHISALQQYSQLVTDWHKTAFATLWKAINREPFHQMSWCLLMGIATFHQQPRLELVDDQPVLPPLPESIEQMIRQAFKCNRSVWTAILKGQRLVDPFELEPLDFIHPRAMELLAEATGAKLEPIPQWQAPVQEPAPAEPAVSQAEAPTASS